MNGLENKTVFSRIELKDIIAKNPRAKWFKVKKDGITHHFFFNESIPNKLAIVDKAMYELDKGSKVNYARVILSNYAINGKEVFNNDADIFLGLMQIADSLVTYAQVELGKYSDEDESETMTDSE